MYKSWIRKWRVTLRFWYFISTIQFQNYPNHIILYDDDHDNNKLSKDQCYLNLHYWTPIFHINNNMKKYANLQFQPCIT